MATESCAVDHKDDNLYYATLFYNFLIRVMLTMICLEDDGNDGRCLLRSIMSLTMIFLQDDVKHDR